MVANKHVLRYLRGNVNTGLVFPRSESIHIEGYTDSDYANCTATRASIPDVLVTVTGSPVHWSSSCQTTFTHTSIEAEYIAANARVLLWLAQLANALRVPLVNRSTTMTIDDKPAATYHNGVVITDERPEVALHVDKGAVHMAHAHGPTKRTKHLDVRHHYLQQCVARKVLRMRQSTTDAQLADCLTKPVGRVKFLQAFRLLQHRD
jgi:hypothetical protein